MLQLQIRAQQYVYIYMDFCACNYLRAQNCILRSRGHGKVLLLPVSDQSPHEFYGFKCLIFLCPTLQNRLRSFNFFPRLYTKISNYFKAQMRDAVKYKFQGNLLRFWNPVSLRQCEFCSIGKYLRRSSFEKFKKRIQFSVVSN